MGKVLERQGIHVFVFVVLGAGLHRFLNLFPPPQHQLWGLTCTQWVWVSWLFAGLSQFWVAINWRLELHHKKLTKWLGKRAFFVHTSGYVILFAFRFMSLLPVSLVTSQTLLIPKILNIPLLFLTGVLGLLAVHGAHIYFGIRGAAGLDHFDPDFRGGKKEVRGVYKYVPNTMYTLGILLMFHPGLFFQSGLGLVVALAHWIFVWAHYFCTEKPDLKVIYGR